MYVFGDIVVNQTEKNWPFWRLDSSGGQKVNM